MALVPPGPLHRQHDQLPAAQVESEEVQRSPSNLQGGWPHHCRLCRRAYPLGTPTFHSQERVFLEQPAANGRNTST